MCVRAQCDNVCTVWMYVFIGGGRWDVGCGGGGWEV